MRSNKGPLIFPTYFSICGPVQWQSRRGSVRNPQGQGFSAATNMNSAGNVVDVKAREIVTTPSSSGCRNTSSVRRLNSGNSSRNSTPWCERLISPGTGMLPPPTNPASLIVWWGERNGRWANSGWSGGKRPMALYTRVVSIDSEAVRSGRMVGKRLASIVLPEIEYITDRLPPILPPSRSGAPQQFRSDPLITGPAILPETEPTVRYKTLCD